MPEVCDTLVCLLEKHFDGIWVLALAFIIIVGLAISEVAAAIAKRKEK